LREAEAIAGEDLSSLPQIRSDAPVELYLDLLKKCLTRSLFPDTWRPVDPPKRSLRRLFYHPVRKALAARRYQLVRHLPFDPQARADGTDWPADAETMVGLRRLDTIQQCVTDVLRRRVPGDLIETGVWRGGATIFMRALLKVYDDTERIVWVADSFEGLPKPNAERYPADAGDFLWTIRALSVSVDQVQANFARYGLLDDQVRFLRGWFKDTMPAAPIERLAVLRLDGDLYESTMEVLRPLYPKLSLGGYVIIDDYHAMPPCKQAVEEFRAEHGITEKLEHVGPSVVWQRLR
jgi:O-methyltransferase